MAGQPGQGTGNKNALGNKGGGRKTIKDERADAEYLWKIFTGEMSREAVEKKLKSGKFSIKDTWIAKALAGNERFINTIVKKLFPDSVDFTANLNQKQMETLEGNVRALLELSAEVSRTYGRAPTGKNAFDPSHGVDTAMAALGITRKRKKKKRRIVKI